MARLASPEVSLGALLWKGIAGEEFMETTWGGTIWALFDRKHSPDLHTDPGSKKSPWVKC